MKYHFETYELSEVEIELLNSYASIGPDGCIVFDGQAKETTQTLYNTCVILLAWKVSEAFGVQRIPVGTEQNHRRSWWARQLRDGAHDAKIKQRLEDLAGMFPDEPVATKIMGWILKRTAFKNHSNHLRCAPDELIVKVEDAPNNIDPSMAPQSDAIH